MGRGTMGWLFESFKSTDSRAPADRFSQLVYAERYLNTAGLRRKLPTFWPNLDWVYQREPRNLGANDTKPLHTRND